MTGEIFWKWEHICVPVLNVQMDWMDVWCLAAVCLVVSVLFSLYGQATAQCWYQTEAAGGMVFPGSVLLPASQALRHGRHGGSGKPHVQQQEDRTYPNSPPPHFIIHVTAWSAILSWDVYSITRGFKFIWSLMFAQSVWFGLWVKGFTGCRLYEDIKFHFTHVILMFTIRDGFK